MMRSKSAWMKNLAASNLYILRNCRMRWFQRTRSTGSPYAFFWAVVALGTLTLFATISLNARSLSTSFLPISSSAGRAVSGDGSPSSSSSAAVGGGSRRQQNRGRQQVAANSRRIQGRPFDPSASSSNDGGGRRLRTEAEEDGGGVRNRELFTAAQLLEEKQAGWVTAGHPGNFGNTRENEVESDTYHRDGKVHRIGSPRITVLQGKHRSVDELQGSHLIHQVIGNKAVAVRSFLVAHPGDDDIPLVGEARESNRTRVLDAIRDKYRQNVSASRPHRGTSPSSSRNPAGAAPLANENVTNLHEHALGRLPQELADRRNLLRRKCDELGLSQAPPNAWEFVINPEYRLVYCNLFKVASTSWITVFNQLAGMTETDMKALRKTPVSLMRMIYPRPTVNTLQNAMKESLSFIVVRDPLERLLSAYRDKLENAKSGHYKMVGAMMTARKYGFNYALHHGPGFSDFVDYVLSTERRGQKLNEHWVPYYRFCTPCSLNFTVIAKTHTLPRDSEFILDTAAVPEEIAVRQRNSNQRGRTRNHLEKYYSQLSEEQMQGLYDLYSPDFELFGYDFAPYFEMVAKNRNKKRGKAGVRTVGGGAGS